MIGALPATRYRAGTSRYEAEAKALVASIEGTAG